MHRTRLVIYCKGMPAGLLANQCTPLGIVNGARVVVYGFVPYPDSTLLLYYQESRCRRLATFQRLDIHTVLCSHPPRCVLLQRRTRLQKSFPELPDDVFPTLKLPGLKVTRNQIPLTPGFAVTDYKVQGATFKTAVLDLRRGQKVRKESHKRFCSTYVQLSRLQSLDGVQLLERIELSFINQKPHINLQQARKELDIFSDNTLSSWTLRFNARRQNAWFTPRVN